MADNKQTTERIVIPGNEWPMHDWLASEIVVAAIIGALQGCSPDDDTTRVAVVDAYGREMPILGVRVRPGSRRGVLEIVADTGDIPAASTAAPAVDVPQPRAGTMTAGGTVTCVRSTTRGHSLYLTVYVDGRPVKYLQADQQIPRQGQRVEIEGVPVIGDPRINMDTVDVRVLG